MVELLKFSKICQYYPQHEEKPFPAGTGVSWQFLGHISNEKPSAIFKLSKVKPTEVALTTPFGQQMMDTVAQLESSTTALIGISVETLDQILQRSPPADTKVDKRCTHLLQHLSWSHSQSPRQLWRVWELDYTSSVFQS